MTLFFSPDIKEFLELLFRHDVKYLIVGGEAVIYYGYARLTGDIDIFYKRESSNIERLYNALNEFWDNSIPGIKSGSELQEPGLIIQFGLPPNRIDLINRIDGIDFDEAWNNRVMVSVYSDIKDFNIYYISKPDLIKNKQASGRPKDLDDINYLK